MMRVPLEELPSLALFAEVVRARSFSEAARRAGLAKSAVSKRIARLEERLGVRLLTRTTRTLALTAEGLRFYEHCAALVDAADAAEQAVSAATQVARGRVTVNAPISFAERYLAEPVAAFLERHPEVELDVSTSNRVVDPVEGGYDVVVRVTRQRVGSFPARRLGEDRVVVCGAPAYFARRGVPATPEELVRHNCLRYAIVPQPSEWSFRGEEGPYAVPTAGNFASDDGSFLREVAVAGLGLIVTPSFLVARELADGRLRSILDDQRPARVAIYAVLAGGRQLALRTRLFVDHLARHFATPRW